MAPVAQRNSTRTVSIERLYATEGPQMRKRVQTAVHGPPIVAGSVPSDLGRGLRQHAGDRVPRRRFTVSLPTMGHEGGAIVTGIILWAGLIDPGGDGLCQHAVYRAGALAGRRDDGGVGMVHMQEGVASTDSEAGNGSRTYVPGVLGGADCRSKDHELSDSRPVAFQHMREPFRPNML